MGLMVKSGTSRDIQVSVRQIRAIHDLMLERNPRSQFTLSLLSRDNKRHKDKCLAYSQAWWWERHGLGLHECCWHWGATVH